MSKPFSPKDAEKSKAHGFPPQIIEAFNELLSEKVSNGYAEINQNEAIERIQKKMDISREDIFAHNYLDVEPLYRKNGWKVEFDKPGYDENYIAYFKFTKK